MRPTVGEQLRGVRLLLERTVVPEVTAPYPSDMLRVVIDTLARLEVDWSTVLPAMRDECRAVAALLGDDGPEPDWVDHDAAIARYEDLRGRLADLVRTGTPEVRTEALSVLAAQTPREARASRGQNGGGVGS